MEYKGIIELSKNEYDKIPPQDWESIDKNGGFYLNCNPEENFMVKLCGSPVNPFFVDIQQQRDNLLQAIQKGVTKKELEMMLKDLNVEDENIVKILSIYKKGRRLLIKWK